MDRNLPMCIIKPMLLTVALRKESVDRNLLGVCLVCVGLSSLSARRVWIEILDAKAEATQWTGRSPQGECG